MARGGETGLFWVYAALALIGAIFPWVIFIPWLVEHGFAPGLFVASLFATPPATIFSADVLYAACVFVLFAIVEGRRTGVRPLWLAPVATFAAGLCCGLPLFLALRERARGIA